MGKRRQRRPVDRKAARWEPEDDWELLGFLDLGTRHRHVFPFNEGNVAGRLHSATSPQDVYTWDQINRRLGYLWQNYGSYLSLNKADIYVEGSACLGLLSEGEHSAIKSNVERLEKELKLTSHNTSHGKPDLKVPATRQPSSTSPLTIDWGQSDTPECDTNDTKRLTPRAQRHQTREFARQSKWKTESPEGGLDGDEAPRKRARRIKQSPPNMYNQRWKQGYEDLDRATECSVKEQQTIENDELEARKANEEDNSLTVASTSEDGIPKELAPLRLGSEIRRVQGDPVPSPATLERIHRAALRKKDEKIMELQETINDNEEKFDEFQTQLDSFGSVQEGRLEGAESLEFLVSNLSQEIRHLKRAKDDSRKIGTFTKLAGSYSAAREEMHMETQVPTTRRLMKNILGGCDDDITLRVPGPNISIGLSALLSFGFGLGLNDQVLLGKEQFELVISNRPPYSIIETLIGAAVCTWVFESDFPNFDQFPGRLSLFTKYRELIAAQDGAVALRNIELASHHALINSPRFHKLIDKEAEDLAASLSKTLAPFFARKAEESEENAFETWGEEEAVWKVRIQRLTAIFKDALKMKADSLLTPECYELVYYAPGTAFDPATMNVETIDGAPIDTLVGKGHRVEHCLHVAILAFTRDTVNDTDPVSKATIQYRNFTRGNATRSLDGVESTVVAKAVVVLRKQGDEDAH